jgi:hypothetical protein
MLVTPPKHNACQVSAAPEQPKVDKMSCNNLPFHANIVAAANWHSFWNTITENVAVIQVVHPLTDARQTNTLKTKNTHEITRNAPRWVRHRHRPSFLQLNFVNGSRAGEYPPE